MTKDEQPPHPQPLAEYKLQVLHVQDVEGFEDVWESASDAVPLLQYMIENADREHLIAVAMGADGRPCGLHTVSIGTLTSALAHPRETFKFALAMSAAGVLVAHNHPTTDVRPSNADVETTIRFRDVGELLGVPLVGSLIIGRQGEWCDILKWISDNDRDRPSPWTDVDTEHANEPAEPASGTDELNDTDNTAEEDTDTTEEDTDTTNAVKEWLER